MSTLYELSGFYNQLMGMLDEPDVDQQSFLETIAEISDEIEVKAENYAKIIRNFETAINGIVSEQQRLTARKNALENSIARLKTNLQDAMIATGKLKFKTDLFSFSIQNNGGTLPVVVDVDVDKLPEDLITVTINKKPNLKAISTYIENTGDVTYAHFDERGKSLRIK